MIFGQFGCFLRGVNGGDAMQNDRNDLISRHVAINALWKAMYKYEDKTEKQFQESEELDVSEWIVHRNYVQDMNDIDRQTILNLPSADPEREKGEWIPEFDGRFTGGAYWFSCSKCKRIVPEVRNGGWNYCPNCGSDMQGEQNG